MPAPLHQQEIAAEGTTTTMNGDLMFSKKEGKLLENFQHRTRSAPVMDLPKLPLTTTSSNYLQKIRLRKTNYTINSNGTMEPASDETSPVSVNTVIDGVLEFIDYDYTIDESDLEEEKIEEEYTLVPVKTDNYVSKRSRVPRGDYRRRELLLDNSFAITDALRALEEASGDGDMADLVVSSGDEESLDLESDDDYDSDLE